MGHHLRVLHSLAESTLPSYCYSDYDYHLLVTLWLILRTLTTLQPLWDLDYVPDDVI